jgi:hypothetical protein
VKKYNILMLVHIMGTFVRRTGVTKCRDVMY